METRHGETIYDPDAPPEGPDGWGTATVDDDPDNEDCMSIAEFRHEDGAVCRVYQYGYDSYGVDLIDGDDRIGERAGGDTIATRLANMAMESYTTGRR